MADAYPLAWPPGFARTPAYRRDDGRFSKKREVRTEYGSHQCAGELTIAESVGRVQRELDRIGARYPVISSNLEPRLDGLPRSGQRAPDDPGVVVYFQLKGKPVALPCDRYKTVQANLAAIAAHLDAVRAIERHGVGTVEQMFAGFQQIRGPGPKPWREVLGIKLGAIVTRSDIEARRRELARQHHPDAGGSDAEMAEINAATELALAELRNA